MDAALPAMRLATLTLLAASAATAAPLGAQVQLGIAADVRAKPGGAVVALLSPGVRLTAGPAAGGETLVTFEGWVDAARLGAGRDSFPASVSGRLTLRVRAQPSPTGAIVAVLQPGAGVHIRTRRGTWAQVRRSAWIATSALQRAPAVASSPVAASATGAAPATAPKAATGSRETGVIASSGARFRDLPVGHVLGGISGGSTVEIMARQFGWVRVRADGWIADKDLVSVEGIAPQSVSAADLRADPQGMRGRVVQWDVEVMSLQTADPLRVELARDEPYLLARGPRDENVLLYLAIPPALLPEARALPALARINVTARVRSGRSEPAGTPILDVLSIAKR